MPLYKVTGLNKSGKKITKEILTSDESKLKLDLRKEGIKLLSYKMLVEKRKNNFFALSSKVSMSEFVSFCNQFAIMLKAGISIVDSLNTLRNQKFSTILKNALSDVYEDVLKGKYLSDAFRRHLKIFPSFFCSMVYIGELSGTLPSVLVKASKYYEEDQKRARKTKSAMIYPIFLAVVITVITFALMIFVVPQFKEMLADFNQELPVITQVVMNISDFFVENLAFILIGLLVVVGGTVLYLGSKYGKKTRDNLKMFIPIVRGVQFKLMTSRFSTAFSILLHSGMEIIDCLKVMPTIIDNEYFNKRFKIAIQDVNNGKTLTEALDDTGLFPEMLIQMTNVGEKASSLSEVYDTVGEYYNEVLSVALARATGMIEPIVIVVMGSIVLVVLLAVMLPMFSMMDISNLNI